MGIQIMQTPLNAVQLNAVQYPRLAPRYMDDGAVPFKMLYFYLLDKPQSQSLISTSVAFLEEQLSRAPPSEDNVAMNKAGLTDWLRCKSDSIDHQYQAYLIGRANGEPRRLFSTKSHALYFIKCVAPTKLVDGAWLYGFTQYWEDERFAPYLQLYLEGLGDGYSERNHVVIFRELLKTLGLEEWTNLDDRYFQQGAIQLALGQMTDYYLPEVIGLNLGYELVPLHLLITAHELEELGVDSHCVTLRVTNNQTESERTKKAVDSVIKNALNFGDDYNYFQRLINGFQLNALGFGSEAIIASFDLQQELYSIIKNKANLGRFMRSNQSKLQGSFINDWLTALDDIPNFLNTFESNGWVRRHQDPENSRFWKLIGDSKAKMFGVFTTYEKQVIYDWIAGNQIDTLTKNSQFSITVETPQFFRNQSASLLMKYLRDFVFRFLPRNFSWESKHKDKCLVGNINQDEMRFKEKINIFKNKDELMKFLVSWMNPAKHHTALGLMATRIYKAEFQTHTLDNLGN